MRKIIDWTCGSFFRTIGRILVYVAIALLITLLASNGYIKLPNLFLLNAKAATLTPKSTFTDSTTHYTGEQEITSFGSNNTYSYSTLPSNVQGAYYWNNASTGSAVSGKAYALSLGFNSNLTAQKYYDITINFRDRDLRYVVNTSSITLIGGTSISGMTDDNISLIGLTNNASSSSNTNKLIIRIYTLSAMSYFAVQITGGETNITSVNNFGISSVSIQEVDVSNTNVIIDNATNNTQNIINNNDYNTQQIIDSNRVCTDYDKNSVYQTGYTLDGSGNLLAGDISRGITNYINIQNADLTLVSKTDYIGAYMCFYDVNKSLISCIATRDTALGSISIPDNSVYLRATIYIPQNKPTFRICQNGNQSLNNSINDLNDNINNDDTSSATSSASNFFSNFTTNTHGLTSIITAPLSAIQSLTSSSCSPLVLPIPFVNENLTLPCMRQIYVDNFGSFMTLYDTITFGIISYWVLVRIFTLVKDFKNPEHDEIEVMDL